MVKKLNLTREQVLLKHGVRSKIEALNKEMLENQGIDPQYESLKIKWTQPAKNRKYTPDFVLPNGIIVECKGRFLQSDRLKHIEIQKQYPELDIRFVFENAKGKILKTSKTTYGQWADQYGFKWSEKLIPQEWINEQNSKNN